MHESASRRDVPRTWAPASLCWSWESCWPGPHCAPPQQTQGMGWWLCERGNQVRRGDGIGRPLEAVIPARYARVHAQTVLASSSCGSARDRGIVMRKRSPADGPTICAAYPPCPGAAIQCPRPQHPFCAGRNWQTLLEATSTGRPATEAGNGARNRRPLIRAANAICARPAGYPHAIRARSARTVGVWRD